MCDYPASVAEEPPPSRRERRRAKRRERRMARGRRLITFRTLLFVILLAAVLAGALCRRPLVRHQLLLRRRPEQRAGDLPGPGRRLPLVPPGRGRAHRGHHRRRSRHATCRPSRPGCEETSVANARAYVANLVSCQAEPAEPRRRSPLRPPRPVDGDDGRRPPPPRRRGPDGTPDQAPGHLHACSAFVALFIQLNNIQVLKANSLANDPSNPRMQLAWSAARPAAASCRRTGPSWPRRCWPRRAAIYKYQRVYNPNTATLFAQIVGFDSVNLRELPGDRGASTTASSPPTPHRPRRCGTC